MSQRCFTALTILLMLTVAFLWAAVSKVLAHSWYPLECCSSMDCAPVDKVEIVSQHAIASFLAPPANASVPSSMVITTKHGTVVVPVNFKMRESQDGGMHACIVKGKLVCLFMPPSM